MKKIMWVFLFVLFLGIPKMAQAELLIERDRTVYYYYDEQNTRREIPLFHNYETNMPVFMINFKGDPEEYLMEEIDVSEIPFNDEEIQYMKDVIAIIMDGRSYPEADLNSLLGIQVLLWELWSEKMHDPNRYSFMVSYALVDYKARVKELQNSYFEPIHYSYQGKVNEKMQTSFVPNFLEEYTLKAIEDAPQVQKEGNTFWFTAEKPGDYEYLVDSSYFEEQVHFYKEGDMLFIELSKPKEKPIYLDYHIEDKEKSHDVHILPSDGVTSKMKSTYEEKENVSISYDLDENYEVLGIHAYTASGKALAIQDGMFVMPKENVVIQIETRKIPSYNVFVSNQEGVTFEVQKDAKARDLVKIHYTLEEYYHLKNLKVTTVSGQEVIMENNTFIMPSENVIISYDLEKEEEPKLYEVYVLSEKGSTLVLKKNTYLEGETVSFTYSIDSGYQLDEITATTADGKTISIDSNSFVMPNQNVILSVKISLIPEVPSYAVLIPQKKGITFHEVGTHQAGEKVSLKYQIDDSYRLTSLKAYTVNGEIPIENNKFIMPDSVVFILYELERIPSFRIFLIPNEHVSSSVSKNSYTAGENVTLSYEIAENFLLDSIHVYTITGVEIPLENLVFSMPSDDVVVEFITKEKMDNVDNVEEHSPKEEIKTYPIPNTKKNSFLPVLLLSLLIAFFLLKIFA